VYLMIKNKSNILFKYPLIAIVICFLGACGSSKPYTLGPIKTFDPDNKNIPKPAESEEHFSWETLYLSTFYQIEKPLDLGRSFQKAGQYLGISGRDEAENVNVLDEVPNSSWYTRRHFYEPMDIAALKQGPNKAGGPDTSRTITVIRGKSEGVTPGFTVKDAKGSIFVIKVDPPELPGIKSSSEVIATKLYYAAGFHTPQNSISFFDPQQLAVGDKATITKAGGEQKMTRADLEQILDQAYKREDGKVRVLASKYVEGQPLGPWDFMGTRDDDPNDRIPHEDRREVRGLRVLASWLNDTDRRTANTLASYVEEGGKKYVRHYLLDMGSTLGTDGTGLRQTKRGQEYRFDPRYMALLYGTLGIYVKPWAEPEAQDRPFYPSIGYFEAELFDPGNWVTSYPNPAFEKVTPRDGFWGAKMVMSFSENEIKAIVKTAEISNSQAEDYLMQVLLDRGVKIGRYWFQKVNPLDKFKAKHIDGKLILTFSDLAVDANLFDSSQTTYRYSVSRDGKRLLQQEMTSTPSIEVDFSVMQLQQTEEPAVIKIQIHTLRDDKVYPHKKIDVYVSIENRQARVVGLERED